ncbi:MAG TPA: NAD(P)-dependent oxidoreductase [Terriglobia bacterium]|nr:NAD(P)-dependent oxidoreductase [Terriglobia bacterium]
MPTGPERIVLLGANGFVSRELRRVFDQAGVAHIAVGSDQVNLIDASAADQLVDIVRPHDSVVFASALTPDKGRDNATLMKNLRMGDNVCGFLSKARCGHMLYISSDGVYHSRSHLINEESPCETDDLYAISHIVREKLLVHACQKAGVPLAIVRPCAIYGPGDTHNSYGPNRFIRTAIKEGKITLFGGGEECRDHIYVRDVAEIILRCLMQGSAGVLNVVSGRAWSFREVAEFVAASIGGKVIIEARPRATAVTHRHFDVEALIRAFPDFRPTPLDIGIGQTVEGMSAQLAQGND